MFRIYIVVFMNRKLYAFILFLGFALPCGARTLDESARIAESILSNPVKCIQVGTSRHDTAYYFFRGEERGYAVISADDRTRAVLAFNEKSRLTSDEMPQQLKTVLAQFSLALSSASDESFLVEESFPSENSLRSSRPNGYAVAPLLGKTCWGQLPPFNEQCPVDNGVRSAAGCRTVALAQVMNYYKYPAEVMRNIPPYSTNTLRLPMPGVAKGTAIDWDNIIEDYITQAPTYEQVLAVSDLISIVGTAALTDYTSDVSSSYCSSAQVLCDYFGYDRDLIRSYERGTFNLTGWNNLLVEELLNQRPVLFEGHSMGGGHAFIVDGVDKQGFFHVNWGWDGVYNGYYDITLLTPPCNDGTGASTTQDGYNLQNKVIVHVVPDNGVKDDDPEEPLLCGVDVTYQTDEEGHHYLFMSFGTPRNYGVTCHVGMGYQDERGNLVVLQNFGEEYFLPDYCIEMTEAIALDPNAFFADGTYKVCVVESQDGVHWRLSKGADANYVSFTKKRGQLYRVDEYLLHADLTIYEYDDKHQQTSFPCVLSLKNLGSKEYCAPIYFTYATEPEIPPYVVYGSGTTLEAKGDIFELEFSIELEPEDDIFYYWVVDQEMNVIGMGAVERDKDDGLDRVSSEQELVISSERGGLYVTSLKGGPLRITTLEGKVVYVGDLSAESSCRIPLKSDIYLVNGRKVMVRP